MVNRYTTYRIQLLFFIIFSHIVVIHDGKGIPLVFGEQKKIIRDNSDDSG